MNSVEKVRFECSKHIIEQQEVVEKEIQKTFEEGTYTFENPYIKLNPYIISPLTALIMFRTEEEVEVSVTVKGKEVAGDISHRYNEKSKVHQVPVLGLYPDYENVIILSLSTGETKEFRLKTQPLKEGVKTCTRIETTSEYMQDQLMFITPSGAGLSAAYDYKGECRWYLSSTYIFDIKRAQNGNLLIGSDRFLERPYTTVGICEMAMVGKIYKEYVIPAGYHHDQLEMEDGNLIILTQDFERGTIEDLCVLVDRNTGEILKTWDFQKILPQEVGKSGSWSARDWFHNNAVWYDKNTNSLSFSGRHQDIIFNIDYDTNKLNWILGDPEGWPQELTDKYFFTPIGEGEFDWQYEQHACMILPDGDVFVFDNGHWRSKNPDKYLLNKDNFSRGVRYHIDTEKMTIKQVWQYGKERGAEFFSPYISNVEYYKEGHYMIHSGGIAFKDDKPSEILGAVLDENDPTVSIRSITVEVLNDKVVYEMEVPSNFYRAEKLRLYHEGKNLLFGKGEILGNLGITEEFLTEVPDVKDEGRYVKEEYHVSLHEQIDHITLNADFIQGQVVMLLLEGETIHKYYIPTSANKFSAMCVGTFEKLAKRAVKFNVSKAGLKGKFNIAIIIDDEKYQTGIEIEV